jgi:hypothetical protein
MVSNEKAMYKVLNKIPSQTLGLLGVTNINFVLMDVVSYSAKLKIWRITNRRVTIVETSIRDFIGDMVSMIGNVLPRLWVFFVNKRALKIYSHNYVSIQKHDSATCPATAGKPGQVAIKHV